MECDVCGAEYEPPPERMSFLCAACRANGGRRNKVDDPTPEEIAARCAEVREGWSQRERERRDVRSGRPEWEVTRGRVLKDD